MTGTQRLSSFLRSARAELARLRGEVITALAVAAVVAVFVSDTAAVIIGLLGIATTAIALLVLSDRLRQEQPAGPPGLAEVEYTEPDQSLVIARARLREIASNLDLAAMDPSRKSLRRNDFTPLVSVVMPCFNDADFVEEALRSLRQQSYQPWECIVVDDASTDHSWDVINETVAGDPRFRTLKMERNSGSGAARNRGIAEATGEYIAFLDADDLLLRESIADRVAALTDHLEDPVVAGSFCAVRSSPQDVSLDSLDDRRHATQPPFIDFVIANGECPFTLHAPLVELDRVRALGGFDQSMTGGAVDWDLWYRMLRNGNVFVPSRTLGAIYRQKQGGITRSNKASHAGAGARLIRAAFSEADPGVMVAPTSFPMPRSLGDYQATLVVAERAIRFAAMAFAEEDVGAMHKILEVLDQGSWPLLDRHIDWVSVVGRGVVRVIGLRPKDIESVATELAPLVEAVRSATAEVTK